ncbi:MAG: hypothetical protein A2504_03530 [Bdellovibrionales bacterium RIFOXYD12_FULL_39_22]|nr:MAG: hypothetical protein A2385_11280 [Bdellovibrionales bacterium RIFOXYB1_FULL_39_21]OFZ41651.1 MAG: hypothetical protein A2485_01590 [Bdellovibrionales bacterium RIFOXYC12_FULL_39_17]OFZ46051.1 MAG: hypothetical protein A2404_11955 [Bdellovibrionales bacterium RIFOXYC1_FULL_39_130]OFZ71165.1 MAG: hypothetical protein A2451_02740 [Bdellovibrionales bacterium RIFOXYC2_FULL_39_8]OFZ74878.1 MAG: hypothetical protein A2560_14995 [Bdellovibrionales bacterium RIFOXYD1_FULL_39_84]OFZ92731.1 MAG:
MTKRRRVNLPEAGVNITSLMDVLTTLLFFLITSFSVNSVTLDTPDKIVLPSSEIKAQAEEAITVALSKSGIWANGQLVAKINGQSFIKKDIADDQRTVIPLRDFLTKELKKRYSFFKDVGDLSKLPPNRIIIQADKDMPFSLVKLMLHTSAATGYADYQFVVVNEGG